MGYYDDDRSVWTDLRVVWAAIACLALFVGAAILWTAFKAGDESPAAAGDQSRPQSQPSNDLPSITDMPSTAAPTASKVSQGMDDCRARWLAQREPLRVAQASLGQWRTHIDAMNRLVAGKISAHQAMSFWHQTRKGAIHRITLFVRADRDYRDAAPRCPDVSTVQPAASPRGERELGQCNRTVALGDRVLAIADDAIMTWEHHVHDMDMMRAGKLSVTQAARMWQAKWREGNRQLHRYDRAVHHAVFLRCP